MRTRGFIPTMTIMAIGALIVSLIAFPVVGSAQEATPAAGDAMEIEVPLINAEEEEVGTATFSEGEDGVTVSVTVEGLEPGEHGWHLHETGECLTIGTDPFESAGGHWNPTFEAHGGPDDEARHVGDFGNFSAGEDGTGQAEITVDTFTLGEGENSVFDTDGTAIIIHAGEDDLESQPSGDSGPRYACGVVAEPTFDATPEAAATPEA